MDLDRMSLSTAISEELLGHLRESDRLFSSGPRTRATYDTTFHGCFRVEIDHGPASRVAIEHVGGDGAFDWSMAEFDRRSPSTKHKWDGPSEPPTQDDVAYRVELFEADPAQSRKLLELVQDLDWGEPTPTSGMGRDGVILSGSLDTEVGARMWTTWSPDPDVEPAKSVFFLRLLKFALDHSSGSIHDDLARVSI